MQFVLIAQDYPDALPRRMLARQAHLDLAEKLKAEGHLLHAVAVLNDKGEMCGSVVAFEFPDRAQLEAHLAHDPYVIEKVWDKLDIRACKVAPAFARK